MKNLKIALHIFICSMFIYACTSSVSEEVDETENYDAGIDDDIISHELEKERLLEEEQANFTKYLVLDAGTFRNLKGEWVLKGTIENKAVAATYKSIKLRAIYFDKRDSIITTSVETINSPFPPNQALELKYKLSKKPKKTKRVSIDFAE